jgi:MFS family permease
LVSHAVSGSGQTLGTVAVSVVLFDRTGSAGWVAAGATARLLPYVLLSATAGVVAGRLDRRRVLIGASVARALLTAGLAAAVATGAGPAVLVALSFFAAAAGTPCYPAMAASLGEVTPAEHLTAASAMLSTVETGAFIVGPALGGLLLAIGPPATALWVNAGLFVVAIALFPPVPLPPIEAGEQPGGVARVSRAVRAVTGNADAAIPLLLVLVINFAYGAATVLLVPIATRLLGLGKEGYGLLNAALGGGAFAGLLVSGKLALRRDPFRIVVAGVVATAGSFALLAAAPPAVVAAGLMVVAGSGSIVVEVIALTLLQRSVPVSLVAEVAGMFDTVVVSAVLLGSVAGPLLLRLAGERAAIAIIGSTGPVAAALTVRRLFAAQGRAQVRLAAVGDMADKLAALPVLRHAPRVVVEALAAKASVQQVAAGTDVIVSGDVADDFFVLCDGAMDVIRLGTVVNRLGAGAGFGEIGLLAGVPRTATVRAAVDSVVARVRGADFVAAVNRPSFAGASTPGGSFLAQYGGQ